MLILRCRTRQSSAYSCTDRREFVSINTLSYTAKFKFEFRVLCLAANSSYWWSKIRQRTLWRFLKNSWKSGVFFSSALPPKWMQELHKKDPRGEGLLISWDNLILPLLWQNKRATGGRPPGQRTPLGLMVRIPFLWRQTCALQQRAAVHTSRLAISISWRNSSLSPAALPLCWDVSTGSVVHAFCPRASLVCTRAVQTCSDQASQDANTPPSAAGTVTTFF